MQVARDRIGRPVDHAAPFTNRRSHGIGILIDQPHLVEPPVRRVPLSIGRGGGRGHTQGRENRPGNGRGREPRMPLSDITNIVRPVERRRRAGMGVGRDGLEIETPTQRQVGGLDSQVPLSGEHNSSIVTPGPAVGFQSFPPSAANVHKMLLDICKEEAGFITPEKKLLNSIDKLEKIVMEELQKMKNTPLAKRVEREKNVSTLMSMR